MEIGRQIRKYRERDRFSQEELALKIYVSRQTISNWENNRSYPDIQNLMLLSVLFKVSLDELVNEDVDVMKKEIDRKSWNRYGYVMLIASMLGLFLMVPAIRNESLLLTIIAGGLIALSFSASIKVERLKARYDINTYQDIIAFLEGGNKMTDKNALIHKALPYVIYLIMSAIVVTLGLIIF
ncbi:helix-turn-helix transcriptional regulator [Salinicoccus sp. YB14-2]|uniref:helix-turn-helix transcriptional regulator n=1 Tax=Salinicoccus sp. YB14-2 TaxID=1572701 RepID=UPI00068B122A|nr:helix-turn-helix transcriptional regulator [Salinicoccus sp. YB14-2]